MKEKEIQTIINIIVVINIIIITLLVYHLIVKNKYSLSYIRKFSEKNCKHINYILDIEQEDIEQGKLYKTRITQKEGCRRIEDIINNSTKWYTNNMVIVTDKHNHIVQFQESETNLVTIGDEMQWYKYVSSDNDADNNYKYLKSEIYNNTHCIVIELKNETRITSQGESYYINYKAWIDKESGFILKEEEYHDNILVQITKYVAKINCVTDEILCLPELTLP